jgi:hypothetical protein
MERDTRLQGILYIFRKPHKNSSEYEGHKKEAHLHDPQKRGPYGSVHTFPNLVKHIFRRPQ